MNINIHNYEIYFIDYFDGNLSVEAEAELMLFLDNNSDLKEEFDSFELFSLAQDKIVFEKKASLKKTEIQSLGLINEENYENKFIAYHEGDLNISEKNEVEKFIELNPSLNKEFELFASAKLTADEIVFENKSQLKRKKRIIPIWQYGSVATAASIALLISIFWIVKDNSINDNRIVLNLNYTESRNINIQNDLNLDIAEREILQIDLVEDNYLANEINPMDIQADIEDNSFSGQTTLVGNESLAALNEKTSEGIKFINSQGKDINVTGLIDCAKLLKRNPYVTEELYALVDKPQKKSLFSRVLINNTNKLADAVSPERGQKLHKKDKDPGLLRFLQGGVSVFNTITGSDVEQLKVYDHDGNLKNYQIETPMLTLNKNYGPQGAE